MGAQKALLLLGRTTLLERALAASAAHPRVLVVAPALASHVPQLPGLLTILNDEPERGMTHSLRLAEAAIDDRDAALAVVLADTPFVDAELVALIVAARGEADVAYPVRGGNPGHPVIFGPAPRALIRDLPDGDTLHRLRADAGWARVEVAIDDDRPFLDLDTAADLEAARARPEPPVPQASGPEPWPQ